MDEKPIRWRCGCRDADHCESPAKACQKLQRLEDEIARLRAVEAAGERLFSAIAAYVQPVADATTAIHAAIRAEPGALDRLKTAHVRIAAQGTALMEASRAWEYRPGQ